VDLVAGIDIATAEVRATIADAAGAVHGAGRAALAPPTSPRPGHREQDPSSWWPATMAAISEATAALPPGSIVVAATVCATSGTVVALDSSGDPIGPALMYDDQRDRWRWLAEHTPGVARLAHAADVVVSRLVGHATPTDWSHALKSGYDPQRGAWRDDLDVAARLLPDVVAPTTAVGGAVAGAGLAPGCEIRLGMTDGCASQIAAGAAAPGRFVSVLGTTLVLKGATVERIQDPTGVVYSHRHPDGWWLPGGASNTGGAALGKWADLTALDRRAAEHGPARHVVYPLVGRGERCPFRVADAEAFRLGTPADDVDRYRAALEGVAFVERLGYERLAALGAPATATATATATGIVASGRGSGSRVWNRIRATVLARPVTAAPHASTSLGACILAAAGSLHPDLAAATVAMAVTGEQVDPDESERDALEHSFERFRAEVAARGWM
jgi:sugar (pentulose or hexulose) kinase